MITPSYKPAFIYGGPIFSVSYLSECLSSKNINIVVFTTNADGKQNLDYRNNTKKIIEGVSVYYFKRQTKDHTHLSFGLLYKLWKEESKYDAIHIHSWWNTVAVLSLILLVLKKHKNIILSPRGMLSYYTLERSAFKRIFHLIIGDYLLSKIKIHVTSQNELNQILTLNNKYNVSLIPNLIKLNFIDITKSWDKDKLELLYLSRIHPKKNIEIVFNALASLNKKFRLKIVGDGDPRYINVLKKLSESLKISDNIEWLGSKYGEEKESIFEQSELYILVSHDENFANSVLESLSFKTPVLISSNIGMSKFVNAYNVGWVCDDLKSIVSVLNQIISDKSLLFEKSENCLNAISMEFNQEIILNNYIKLYKHK